MAALSANSRRKTRDEHLMTKGNFAAGTGGAIYEGSLVVINESTGRAIAATAATARTFLGVSLENVTGNTGGTVKVNFAFGHQELMSAITGVTAAFTGTNALVATDNTVDNTSVGTALVRVVVGEIMEIPSANLAWVRIRHASSKAIP